MFIYHFSRLIKSKLLWGALALLMVFAFVVADSCSGPSMERSAGVLNGEPVDARVLNDAEIALTILDTIPTNTFRSQEEWQLYMATPPAMRLFDGMLYRDSVEDEEAASAARERQLWTLMAAREAAVRTGMLARPQGANAVLMQMFTGAEGVFDANYYRGFLGLIQVGSPDLFQKSFASAWLPAQEMTQVVFNSVGWTSPMERAFDLAMQYDTTTAITATYKHSLKADAMTVTDAELQAWYDAHKESYEVAEERVITYVEVPIATFVEKAEVTTDDAMAYYEDHPEEFYGTGTNSTTTLPFAEVQEKALAKAKDIKGLADADFYAKNELIAQVQEKGLEALADKYGAIQTATVSMARPFGFQNARTLVDTVFEMDPEYIPYNVISGTDRVYVVGLQKIVATHIPAFDAVKERVTSEAKKDALAKQLKADSEALRTKLVAELEKGVSFEMAVANLQLEGLTLSAPATFVLADNPTLEIAHSSQVLAATETLATKTVSDPIVIGDETLFVYVTERTPGDSLKKATNAVAVAKEASRASAFELTRAWLQWNLDRDPPVDGDGAPLLMDATTEE